MKVEQLKAELVVFKGLMSNVSSDFPLGSQGPSDGLRAPTLQCPVLSSCCSSLLSSRQSHLTMTRGC